MNAPDLLPAGFEGLSRFVPYWAGDTTNDRVAARSMASMEQIREFYDAIVDRADEALRYLDEMGIDNLTPDAGRLAKLVLAMGQAAVAIEVHGAPRAPGTEFPHGIKLVRGPQPFG